MAKVYYDLLDPDHLDWLQAVYNGEINGDWAPGLVVDGSNSGGHVFSYQDRALVDYHQRKLRALARMGAFEMIGTAACITDAGMEALRQWPAAELDQEDR